MVRPVRLALLFGVLAAAIFVGITTLLGALLPDYDPISQTISEIGERGSPFETVFMAAELVVAACLLVFALGLGAYASATARSIVPAILLGSYGLANVGTAVFEAPH